MLAPTYTGPFITEVSLGCRQCDVQQHMSSDHAAEDLYGLVDSFRRTHDGHSPRIDIRELPATA